MKLGFLLLLCLAVWPAWGQNHPELQWQVVETEHFRVMYHEGLEGAAARAAEIAEHAYGPVTRLYDYQPSDKVRIVLKDYDDYANGAAYFYHDTIEIWTSALEHDFELRGTSDWLRNVITHEFVHIVSLAAARRMPQRIPAIYLQYFGYEREKNRPDILIGYPDVLASYPIMNAVVPMWFAEGVAQYQVLGARFDRWDSHRDMILRTAVLDGGLLGFDEMGVFGKKGFGNEFVYDHGYGLVSHIASQYGEDKLAEICRAAAGWTRIEFDGALEEVLGKSSRQLYAEWRAAMEQRYEAQVADLGTQVAGEEIVGRGFSNRHPALAPEGERLAYLSTGTRDYGPHALVVRQLEEEEDEVLAAGVTSAPSWSPDGRRLLFVRKDKADKYGSRQADIYEYDLDGAERGIVAKTLLTLPAMVGLYHPETVRVRRLSRGLRALYASYSPDGRHIAFVRNGGSSNNLGVMAADGGQIRYLTSFEDGTQLYAPQWSPDGRQLVFSISRGGHRDIARIDVPADQRLAEAAPLTPQVVKEIEVLVSTPGTDRDPVWTDDGAGVVFSSDHSGIFNLYRLDIASGQLQRLTNVVGGAFNPSVGADGTVAFAAYGAGGFSVRRLDGEAEVEVEVETTAGAPHSLPSSAPAPQLGPGLSASAYGTDFLETSVLPRLSIDEGRFKGGVYLSGSDVLLRQNVFAGAAWAPANGDRDVFAVYEYRGWRPTLFLEWFHQKRTSARRDSSEARDLIVTGTNFTLNQFNAGLRQGVGPKSEVTLSLTYDRYDASVLSDAFLPRRDGSTGFERTTQKPFGYTYLNGFDLGLTYRYEGIARRRDRDISPRGRRIYFRYDRFYNYFLEGFDQSSTFIDEEYLDLFYNQFILDWNEYIGLPGNTALDLRFYGGWIASDEVDDPDLVNDFFDFHLGGIQFMKGYTFYSIEGRKAAMGSAALRFPLLPDMRWRLLHLYLDKVYGAVYGDIGKAWDDDFDAPDAIYGRKGPLRDVGVQLRFDLISYYSIPTRVQFDAAYGIDEIADKSPWKYYLTVLFGYL
jgi:Tol biopolymer transport system component